MNNAKPTSALELGADPWVISKSVFRIINTKEGRGISFGRNENMFRLSSSQGIF